MKEGVMKRVLIALVVAAVGLPSMAQLSGEFQLNMVYIPEPQFVTGHWRVDYTISGITLTSLLAGSLYEIYFTWIFGVSWTAGPFTVTGMTAFDLVPAYTGSGPGSYAASEVMGSLDLSGVALSLTARHWIAGYWIWEEPAEPPCGEYADEPGAGLQYIFHARVFPISMQIRFVDCCAGASFQDVVVTLENLGLCCGITYDSELALSKAGFQHLTLSLRDIAFVCCGIALDATVTFTTNAKQVSVTPKWAGLGEGCFAVYGDINWLEDNAISFAGIRLDGFKIRCQLADCAYVEFVTFLHPENAWMYGYHYIFYYAAGEFEYLKLGLCGPACCGGKYTFDLMIMFKDDAFIPSSGPSQPAWRHWPPSPIPFGDPLLPRPPWFWPSPPWPTPPTTALGISHLTMRLSVPVSAGVNLFVRLDSGLILRAIIWPPSKWWEWQTVLSFGFNVTF